MTTRFFRMIRTDLSRECESLPKCEFGKCSQYEDESEAAFLINCGVNTSLDEEAQEFINSIPDGTYADISDGWMIDENLEEQGEYLDLIRNQERYNGYNGSDIWKEIYFKILPRLEFFSSGSHKDLLYRLISGIHTSVSMHISHTYLEGVRNRENFTPDEFAENYKVFYDRVGKYPDRIKNLFYTYIFFIDALSHVKVSLRSYSYYTNDPSKNQRIQNRMKWLGHYISGILDPDKIQSDLYNEIPREDLIQKIQPVLRKITELLNWVEWDISKLNSKVEFAGLAAMFKIIFTEKGKETELSQNEVVGLINTVFRISSSILWYEQYLGYEAKESFYKMALYCIILCMAGMMFILSILVHWATMPSKRDETRIPLRAAGATPS